MTDPAASTDGDHDQNVAKLARLIKDVRICMFTTMDADDRLMSRPMAVQEVEFDGDLWFFTKRSSRKAKQIAREPRVNVALASRSSWVSVSGEAEVVHDDEKAKELWNAGISAWFPEGPEYTEIILVKIHADGAEYWDTPGAAAVSILFFIKSRVTGKPYHIEDQKVSL